MLRPRQDPEQTLTQVGNFENDSEFEQGDVQFTSADESKNRIFLAFRNKSFTNAQVSPFAYRS
eukprot:137823-Amorphochlora_amoeboformis.AAC.1